MALPILDGNQTAATLSTVLTSGEHIPAHTVVSLGSQAITDVRSAVSGSVVSISNFPSTQTIAGTVTANAFGLYGGIGNIQLPIIGFDDTIEAAVNGYVVPVQISNASGTIGGGNPLPISGTVTVGNSITIGSLPAISGTVTANIQPPGIGVYTFISESGTGAPAFAVGIGYNTENNTEFLAVNDTGNNFPVAVNNSVTIGSLPAISGTVTVGNTVAISGTVTANPTGTQTIAGTVTVSAISTSVTARLVDSTGTAVSYAATGSAGTPSTDVISVQGVSGGTSLPISGTAGTLTTRFGSVTTAGTAQISSAVTNASRKYLLIQNVTTSSNVITIGIGFTPTTTQGIQLTAGAGITFESSYIPTGAVYVLSSVTASPFTILEA